MKSSLPVSSPEKNAENQLILEEMQLTTSGIGDTIEDIVRSAEQGKWSVARDMRETAPDEHSKPLLPTRWVSYRKISMQMLIDSLLMARRSQNLTQQSQWR